MHPRQAVPLDDQRAGEHPGQRVAARRGRRIALVAGTLADRDGFAGQQRLVDQQRVRLEQQGIGRDAVAFRQNDEVAPHHLGGRNAHGAAVAHDGGRGRAHVAQCLERALRAAFLEQGHAEQEHHHRQQDDALARFAQQQVEQGGADEQDEHRLARRLGGDGFPAPSRTVREAVLAVARQPPRGLGAGQPCIAGCGMDNAHGLALRGNEAAVLLR